MLQAFKDKLGAIISPVKQIVSGHAAGKPKAYGEFEEVKLATRSDEENKVVLISWNSEEGRNRLFRSAYNEDFFRLAHVYQPQINPFYAGVAASVITLNGLRVKKGTIPNQEGFDFTAPTGKEYHYTLYSQLTLLNDKTERVKRKVDIAPSMLSESERSDAPFKPGLNLYQVMHILQIYEAEANMWYADKHPDEGIDQFTADLKATLNDPEKILIANFYGEGLGLDTDGHFSVVGAYDDMSESLLVLDTAAHKNPWYWVPIEYLYHAMHTKQGDNYRGYLIVNDTKGKKK